jgi:hypothetical protein
MSFGVPAVFSVEKGHKKIYKITYGVKIGRLKGEFKWFRLGLPLFLNNSYQRLLSYKISTRPQRREKSDFHHLKYFVFDLEESLNSKPRVYVKIEAVLEKRKPDMSLDNPLGSAKKISKKDFLLYTSQNGIIQKDHPYAKWFAKKMQGLSDEVKLKKIFSHVRAFMRYNPRFGRYGSFSSILRRRQGDCGDYSIFLVTLLRASGIPSRTVTGRVLKTTLRGSWHAWAECYIKPWGWIPLDPANFDIRDEKKLIGYMPYNYAATHYGVNVLVPSKKGRVIFPVIQTYFYFQKSRGRFAVNYTFDFLWNVKEIS